MFRFLPLFALSLCTATSVWAQMPNIRPGLWEFSMPGVASKHSVCLTPEMLKDTKSLGQQHAPDSDCKSSDERTSGNTRSFKVSCTKPTKYDASIVMTVNGEDNFSMKQDYTMERGGRTQQGKLSMSYQRIGSCPTAK